jgi:hypothetical protein
MSRKSPKPDEKVTPPASPKLHDLVAEPKFPMVLPPIIKTHGLTGAPPTLKPATARAKAFKPADFGAFFEPEIEAELQRTAVIYNDRMARWRCQCCDTIIPIPRRTIVYHGAFVLEHDDRQGLLVNGEKYVPRSETPLEIVQPGRFRDPYSGEFTGKLRGQK